MIAVSSLSSSLFPIYGVASAEVPFSAAVAEGRELRSLLQSFGIKRKEAARTLGTTRGEILRWCLGTKMPPRSLASALRVAPDKQEALAFMVRVRKGHWDIFQEGHPFWQEALAIRKTMRAWQLSAEDICDATGMSPDAFQNILLGLADPGKYWADELRQLHDLKRSMPYWREAEKLRAAMEKWGITVQDLKETTCLSQAYIYAFKRGQCNPLPIFSAFRDASNRVQTVEKFWKGWPTGDKKEKLKRFQEKKKKGICLVFTFRFISMPLTIE